MTPNLKAACILTVLFLFPSAAASASFGNTYSAESPSTSSVGYHDASTLEVSTLRHFNVTQDVNVTASLAATPPVGYRVAFYFSADNVTFTKVADAVNTTAESQPFAARANTVNVFRAVVSLPAGNHDEGVVELAYVLMLNVTDAQAGNGGSLHPSILHRHQIIYYNPQTDTDRDGLPDSWEGYYFGSLQQGPNGDPDGDGFTNLEEYQSCSGKAQAGDYSTCSNPTQASSVPEHTVYGGGGGIEYTDREITSLAAGLTLFSIVLLVALLVAHTPKREKSVAYIVGSAAVAVLVAVAVTAAVSNFSLHNDHWQWWTHYGIGWQQYLIDAVLVSAILIVAAFSFLKLDQKAERHRALLAASACVLVVLAVWICFTFLGFSIG